MCESFADCGIEVELWGATRDNHIKENIFDYYSLRHNFKFKIIKHFDIFKYRKYLGPYSQYLLEVIFLSKFIFTKFDKDTVVYHTSTGLTWLLGKKGVKNCYECHDWFSSYKWWSLYLLKKSYLITTTNSYIKKEFVKSGFCDNSIHIAPNGVCLEIFNLDLNKEQALLKLGLDSNLTSRLRTTKILLYTGSLKTMGHEKGIYEILKSLTLVKLDNVLFLVVGGCVNDINFYKKIANDLGVEGKVMFIEKVNQEKLALFQKIADVLLMPFPDRAHYKYHMSPMKTFEYMASGRPIITSSLPSIMEILNKENSLICNPDDYEDLAEKINTLLEDNVLAKRISSQALVDVKNYTWRKRSEGIIEFINESLNKV